MASRSQEKSESGRQAREEVLVPGTTLLTCEPFVYAGYRTFPDFQFCDACLTVDEKRLGFLRRCMSCQMVLYCNRTCQERGWKDGHKYECKGMKRNSDIFEGAPRESVWDGRILLRTLFKLQDGTDHFDELEIGGTKVKRRFADLMSHPEELRRNKERMDRVDYAVDILTLLLGPNPKIQIPADREELVKIYAKISTNAFEITDGFYAVGSGVYLGSSIFNHSCDPMAEHVFDGLTMYVRNIREIPKSLPIDKVTVSYIDLLMPSSERRKSLKKGYHFHCECERCTTSQHDKEMCSIICPNKGCHAKIDTKEMNKPCSACGHVMKMEAFFKALKAEKDAVQLLDQRILDLPLIETSIQKMKALNYSDSHWVMIKLFKLAVYAAGGIDASTGKPLDRQKAFEYSVKYFKIAKNYLHPNDRDLLRCSHELSYLAWMLRKLDEAEMYLPISKSIAEVLFGKNSKFWRNNIVPVENGVNKLKLLREMNLLVLA